MTETTWTEEHVPASDLWSVDKSLTPITPEEKLAAWRTTTGMLDRLRGMADSLMLDPLILADALGRAREEERRAEDRITRPDGVELGPREEQRL